MGTSTVVPSTSIPIGPHLPHGVVAAEKHCYIVKCVNKLKDSSFSFNHTCECP